ncbi:hypothetical protein HDU96_010638 [Phlyctochytrium bullatum]|nr:hypothetical protein HDU96_010638 [Phlyctochytrium bullatum]
MARLTPELIHLAELESLRDQLLAENAELDGQRSTLKRERDQFFEQTRRLREENSQLRGGIDRLLQEKSHLTEMYNTLYEQHHDMEQQNIKLWHDLKLTDEAMLKNYWRANDLQTTINNMFGEGLRRFHQQADEIVRLRSTVTALNEHLAVLQSQSKTKTKARRDILARNIKARHQRRHTANSRRSRPKRETKKVLENRVDGEDNMDEVAPPQIEEESLLVDMDREQDQPPPNLPKAPNAVDANRTVKPDLTEKSSEADATVELAESICSDTLTGSPDELIAESLSETSEDTLTAAASSVPPPDAKPKAWRRGWKKTTEFFKRCRTSVKDAMSHLKEAFTAEPNDNIRIYEYGFRPFLV